MLQNKNFLPILKAVWLTESDANIYLSLVENGLSALSDIATQTGYHRIQIYRRLPFLLESGFLIEVKKGKRNFYKACHPEKINEIYERNFQNNKAIIESLSQKYESAEKKTNISFQTGLKWIQNVYYDILNSSKKWDTFFRITSEVDVDKINEYYIPKDYREKRDKKQIQRYIIMTEKTANKKKPKLEREVKIIDGKKEKFDDNISFTIYSDKISFVDFNKETSIIIESKEIADFQRKIFQLLFKKL